MGDSDTPYSMDSPRSPGKEIASIRDMERVAAYHRHVFQGGSLIRDGKYIEAIAHFRNTEVAQKAGLLFSNLRQIPVNLVTLDNVESIANSVAWNSWFFNDDKSTRQCDVLVNGRHLDEKAEGEMSQAEITLSHEIALIHMEECLHGLQYLRGVPLANKEDCEIDVAAYMHKNGIPMTKAFLHRYDRGMILFGDEGSDDSLAQVPAMRKGTFVNVVRKDGKVESDWQITGFDPQNGEAIVKNYAQNIQKRYPKDKQGHLNQGGVYPFRGNQNFSDIFMTIDRLKCVFSYNGENQAEYLKSLIADVQAGKKDVHLIPRSGGLRIKVAELLNINTPKLGLEPTINL